MVKTKEIVEIQPQDSSVENLISQAIAGNVPVETLERLFALRKEVKAERAKEAFVVALGAFQGASTVIQKTKKVLNKDGRTVRYAFAPLEAIVEQIKKPLMDNKLSYSWDVQHQNGHMIVTAKITHALGHFDTSTFEIPIDTEGYMTAPQKYASAQTFAKRYTLCNALGISTGDEDTDATDVGKESDAKSVKAKITLRLRALAQKTETREEVEQAVKKLTSLNLKEENYEEIASRLQVLVDESHEDKTIQ